MMKKTETVIMTLSFAMFLGLMIWNIHLNGRQALERLDLCYQHTKEVNLPIAVCSQINQTFDSASRSAQTETGAWVVFIFGFLIVSQLRIKKLEGQLKELQKKLDV